MTPIWLLAGFLVVIAAEYSLPRCNSAKPGSQSANLLLPHLENLLWCPGVLCSDYVEKLRFSVRGRGGGIGWLTLLAIFRLASSSLARLFVNLALFRLSASLWILMVLASYTPLGYSLRHSSLTHLDAMGTAELSTKQL